MKGGELFTSRILWHKGGPRLRKGSIPSRVVCRHQTKAEGKLWINSMTEAHSRYPLKSPGKSKGRRPALGYSTSGHIRVAEKSRSEAGQSKQLAAYISGRRLQSLGGPAPSPSAVGGPCLADGQLVHVG